MNHRVPAVLTMLAVVASLLVSCGDGVRTVETGGGEVAVGGDRSDGTLDCAEGQVTRGTPVGSRAATEAEVVELALARWAEAGATIVAVPPDESWSAVVDGRDVAIAYPEREGDGGWVVSSVSVCDEPDRGPAPIDARLDCAGDVHWAQMGALAPDAVGEPTAGQAIEAALAPYADRLGGMIKSTGPTTGSVVVDDREQVTANAIQVSSGGWVVNGLSGCEGVGP